MTDAGDMHQEFLQVWSPRWNQHAENMPQAWDRALAFVKHFLPHAELSLCPITPSQWMSALHQTKPRAARGPDGFARSERIEQGQSAWPEQLLVGLVFALSKHNGKEGLIYRTWAGIRARELLRHLARLMPCTHNLVPVGGSD